MVSGMLLPGKSMHGHFLLSDDHHIHTTFLMVASMSVPPRGADGDLFQGCSNAELRFCLQECKLMISKV